MTYDADISRQVLQYFYAFQQNSLCMFLVEVVKRGINLPDIGCS